MGILGEPAAYVKALPLPHGFSVCELGDQKVSFTKPASSARAFYQSIGCGHYVAIDGNGNGDILADLNHPVVKYKLGQFDLVTDFGTGEHIFDQAQVWRTLHDLCKPGRFIAFDRPTQGYEEHCFYLATESLYRDLAKANHYEVVKLKRKETPRGFLLRGVFQRQNANPFVLPQQGRYKQTLRLPAHG